MDYCITRRVRTPVLVFAYHVYHWIHCETIVTLKNDYMLTLKPVPSRVVITLQELETIINKSCLSIRWVWTSCNQTKNSKEGCSYFASATKTLVTRTKYKYVLRFFISSPLSTKLHHSVFDKHFTHDVNSKSQMNHIFKTGHIGTSPVICNVLFVF